MQSFGTIVPGAEGFTRLAGSHRVIPVSMTLLADGHTPLSIYRALAMDEGRPRPGSFLMESAAPGAGWSRHSFIGVNSLATLTEAEGRAHWSGEVPAGIPREGTTAEVLRDSLEFLGSRPFREELPHLTSGLIGYAGWETVRHWERLPDPPEDDLGLPEMAMNLVGDLVIHDNRNGTVTPVSYTHLTLPTTPYV